MRYGLLPAGEIGRRDGLDLLQAMCRGDLPLPPFYGMLGVELTHVEHGRVVLRGIPGDRCYSLIGTVHAGFTSAMLSAALVLAVQSTLPSGETATPVEFKVNLVRPLLQDSGPIDASGAVLYRGRTVATTEGKVIDAAGKLYAHATATCTIVPVAENR